MILKFVYLIVMYMWMNAPSIELLFLRVYLAVIPYAHNNLKFILNFSIQ